jgi:GNAT superfamily N-acetyltransferase
MSVWTVRQVISADEEGWRSLYRGYRAFYQMPVDEGKVDVVWNWILDASHEVDGIVVANEAGILGGLANFRRFARPLGGTVGLYLDDLYTREDLRGQGAGRTLLAFLHTYAVENGLSVVRWITAESNSQARLLYDSVANATSWVTYDLT